MIEIKGKHNTAKVYTDTAEPCIVSAETIKTLTTKIASSHLGVCNR